MRNLIFLLLLSAAASGFARDEDSENSAGSLLAAKVREAGHACNAPSGLERTLEGAAEGETVWTVACDGVRYRVSIHGDTGTTVETLD